MGNLAEQKNEERKAKRREKKTKNEEVLLRNI